MGTPLDIELFPTRMEVEETGLVVGMGATVTTDVQPSCVDPSAHSVPAETDWPTMDGTALDSALPYDFGLFLSQQFMDQILYAAWASGALCLDVAEVSGLVFTGEMVSSFFGDEIVDILGNRPLDMGFFATVPPTIRFDDDQPPIIIDLNEFELDLSGELDERMTRILSIDLSGEMGLYTELNGNTMNLSLPLNSDHFVLTELYSELMSPGYSAGVPNLLDIALESFSPSLPTVMLPSIMGISLDGLAWQPTADQTWQGGYIFLDVSSVEPIDIGGCSADGFGCDGGGPSFELDLESAIGCDEAQLGCEESGCASTGKIRLPGARIFGFFLVLLGAMLRRR